ncbi:MAG: TetR/AcrR family transcriptional regulator [Pseudomonadota bacterium]|nr:TetR/AcrR family transcriptional regulator [Pseudomonadota bacterium]
MPAIQPRSNKLATDRRSQRTRAALLEAFARMILSEGFDAITPSRLAAAANVGRSTFYEHFANVEEVLAFSISSLLQPLVDSAMQPMMQPGTVTIVQHFWENRRIARAMFTGGGHTVMVRLFTEQFEGALTALRAEMGITTPMIAPRLAATHLASGSLAMLGAWLTGQASGSAAQVAEALHAAGYASARAMSAGT